MTQPPLGGISGKTISHIRVTLGLKLASWSSSEVRRCSSDFTDLELPPNFWFPHVTTQQSSVTAANAPAFPAT